MTLSAPPTPVNIITDYTGWCGQHDERRAEFYANCPLERSTTYYFSTSGDDDNDGLTELTPKQTIAHLVELHDASSGDIRFRLKRGDMWRGTDSLISTKAGVTLDCYGDGADDRPFLNFHSLSYSSGWTSDTGAYRQDVSDDIAFLRLESDRKGEGANGWLIELNSAAAVQSTPWSFAWVSGSPSRLWVNLDGTDPNTVTLEAVISGSDSGIDLAGDGSRLHGIRCDGAGSDRTAAGGTQKHPFRCSATGSDAVLFTDFEGYISHTHIAAHYSTSGGRSWWERGTCGGTRTATGVAGTSVFNTFATTANGVETHFNKCYATYGQYRNHRWSYATDKVEGAAFLSHTGSGDFGLLVIRDCYAPTSTQGVQTLTHISNMSAVTDEWDVTQARGFVVDCTFAQPVENHVPNFCWLGSNTVYYGMTISGKPAAGGVSAMEAQGARRTHCYLVNSLFNLDMTYAGVTPSGYYGFMNGSSGTGRVLFLHTDILRTNITRASGADGSGDHDVTTQTVGTGVQANSKAFNCIFQGLHSSGSSTTYVGLSNQSANLKNNAYRNMVSNAAWEGGYANDGADVTLTSDYTFGTSHAQLLGAGTTTVVASHDINGKARTVSPPDIGATDYSSPITVVPATFNRKTSLSLSLSI